MKQARGADFSSAQDIASVDRAIKEGIAFAFVKATQGTGYVNPLFSAQRNRLESAGVFVGAYHFLSHDVDGATQWDHFEPYARKVRFVCCDQETDRGVLVPDGIARAFIRRGRQRGFKVGRYGDNRVIGRNLGEAWKWRASWSRTPPPHPWEFWQFSDGDGRQDWNVFNGDREALHAFVRKQEPRRAPVKRWWMHDDSAHHALGPYRLPTLIAMLAGYLAKHPRSAAVRLVRT